MCNFVKLIGMLALALPGQAQVTATFYPEQEVNIPATGEPISIYRVDVRAESANGNRIFPIEVFRAWPALIPLTRERALLDLATKTERSPLRIAGNILVATASASTVVLGIQTFIKSTNPDGDAKNAAKWSLVSAGAAFVGQYAPAIGRQIIGAAPVYSVPEDTLSAAAFDLAAGEAKSFHIVARGPLALKPESGQVRAALAPPNTFFGIPNFAPGTPP